MRESQKAKLYAAAIEILVERAVTEGKPDVPGAYAAKCRVDKTARHREHARSIFATVDMPPTAAQLADILEPPVTAVPEPQPAYLREWDGPPVDGTELSWAEAKAKIEAIRARLRRTA